MANRSAGWISAPAVRFIEIASRAGARGSSRANAGTGDRPGRGPGSPRRRGFFQSLGSASHPRGGRINGQAPRRRGVGQPGRVLAQGAAGRTTPDARPMTTRPVATGRALPFPFCPPENTGVFQRTDGKARPRADGARNPQPQDT